MDEYLEEFMSPDEGASRAAVKRLTHDIERALLCSTINAPDWSVLEDPSLLDLMNHTGTRCTQLAWHETYFGKMRNPSTWTILCRFLKRACFSVL